jgi:hypothetical protein
MDTKASYSMRIWLRGRPRRMKETTTRRGLTESTTYMVKDIILMEIHTISSIKTTTGWWQQQLLTISVGKVIEATSLQVHP